MENARMSRRELRLARQAQRLEQEQLREPVVEPVNELVDTGQATAILTPVIADTSTPGEVTESRRASQGPLGNISARAVLATACAFFVALGGGVTLGTLFFDTAASAVTDIAEVATTSAPMESTPESLKAADGAADSARFRAYEEQFAGSPVVCETRNSANSLTSVSPDQINHIIYPMAAGTYKISSPFGARIDPIYGTGTIHSGVDLAAPQGTPIYAVADGTVVFAGVNAYTLGAQLIIVQHNVNGEEFSSWYMHSYSSGVYVHEGDTVKLGQHIADVGSSGHSTGAHLHMEIHPGKFADFTNTQAVDPEVYLKDHHAVDINDVCKAN